MSLEPDEAPESGDDFGVSDEQMVEGVLERIAVGRPTWPTWEEFQPLWPWARRLIERTGGVERWAKEYGLRTLGPGQRHTYSEEEIREALRHFIVAEHEEEFPTEETLKLFGRGTIARAMRKRGYDSWKAEFEAMPGGVTGGAPQRRHWNEDPIDTALREFLAGRSGWPTDEEFIAEGRWQLIYRLRQQDSVDDWQARMRGPYAG
jgi:hypothetical protein